MTAVARPIPSLVAALATTTTVLSLCLVPAPRAHAAESLDPLPLSGGVRATAGATPAPGDTRVTFYAGLRRHDDAAVDELRRVSDPDSARYRSFPSRGRVAAQFGATSDALRTLRRSAGRRDLSVRLDRTGVFARVSGRADDMGQWLSKPVMMMSGNSGGLDTTQYSSGGHPPRQLRSSVREFIPLDLRVSAGPPVGAAGEKPYAGINRGTPRGCLGEVSETLNQYVYSYNQIRTAYGIDRLPSSRAVGRATRVVVLSQGDGFSDEALRMSAECFDLPGLASTDRVPVDGLTGDLPEGTEGDLDVQVVQSVLPAGSAVSVVESSPFDPRWFLVWSTAYAGDRRPDAVTTSYGLCEQQSRHLGPGNRSLIEAVLVRLGLVGTSTFSAAGDRGSSDCINNETGKGPQELAVDYLGATPYVTSVGGTRLKVDTSNHRVQEYVWNSLKGLPPIGPEAVGGGGGTSLSVPRPWWQPAALTHSSRRTVPDLAALAVPGPGWPLFSTVDGETEVNLVGGTSAATPFSAAAVGVLSARQRLAGRPSYGLLQPALYDMAQDDPASFYDITIGDNDLHDRGCCQAHRGYDLASGLGAPNFASWLHALPRPAVKGTG